MLEWTSESEYFYVDIDIQATIDRSHNPLAAHARGGNKGKEAIRDAVCSDIDVGHMPT